MEEALNNFLNSRGLQIDKLIALRTRGNEEQVRVAASEFYNEFKEDIKNGTVDDKVRPIHVASNIWDRIPDIAIPSTLALKNEELLKGINILNGTIKKLNSEVYGLNAEKEISDKERAGFLVFSIFCAIASWGMVIYEVINGLT